MKLQKGTPKDLETVYRDMTHQFPPEELKSVDWLSALIKNRKYDLWLAEEDGKQIAYLMICPCQDYLWLDYIAVFPEHHAKGYGSKILPMLSEVYPDSQGVFLEVEHENKKDVNTVRRIRFYQRLGAEMVFKNYLLPTLEGGFPMGLYFLPYHENLPQAPEILETIRYVFDTVHADVTSRTLLLEQMAKDMTKNER